MKACRTRLLVSLVAFLMVGASSTPTQNVYKEFKKPATLDQYFSIRGDSKGNILVSAPSMATAAFQVTPGDTLRADSVLTLGGGVSFRQDRLQVGNRSFAYDGIVDVYIDHRGDTTVIDFLTSSDTSRARVRARQGNIIRAFEPIGVKPGQFVRGNVISVTGDIDIQGEINKDVVSLFGHVTVGAEAVIRGSIAALAGGMDVPSKATVYGSVLSTRQKRNYRYLLWSRDREFRIYPDLRYNRVDGLHLSLGLAFQDHDSTLPSFWTSGGYAFASERWRYRFGLEQTIVRSRQIVLGGEAYRRLASGDDWLLNDYENMAFVVLAREDFKDYYEAEGGVIYARFSPLKKLTVGLEYRNERTHWLEAHPRLWAVFGGQKRFRDNYSTVDSAFRARGEREIEDSTTSGLNFSAAYDTRASQNMFDSSGWFVQANLEWSTPDLSSDFDYRRYTLGVTRYQKIHRESILLLRAMLGGSDGYLPMHKRFFLGGLGSWQGYGQKEYMGSRFWMTNIEYRLTIPGSDFALSALWDCGQIANNTPLNGNVDVKNSIGLAGYIGADFRISVAKRLDRSTNADAKIYVRLTHPF